MENTDFNELAKEAFRNASEKGFHEVRHSDAHLLMLVVCELAEAVEADRNGRWADRKTYNFLAQEYGEDLWVHLYEMHIKDTVEDELADAVIRLLDFIGMKGYKVPEGYLTKEGINRALDDTFRSKAWAKFDGLADRVFVACVNNIVSVADIPESGIYSVFAVAEMYGIDLMWHVKEKMWYNRHRERLHGKKY